MRRLLLATAALAVIATGATVAIQWHGSDAPRLTIVKQYGPGPTAAAPVITASGPSTEGHALIAWTTSTGGTQGSPIYLATQSTRSTSQRVEVTTGFTLDALPAMPGSAHVVAALPNDGDKLLWLNPKDGTVTHSLNVANLSQTKLNAGRWRRCLDPAR